MRSQSHGLIRVLALVAALLVAWQRPTAWACASGDVPCREHCAILSSSCATACVARVAPAPLEAVPPVMHGDTIAFSFARKVLTGRTIAPDTGPPRLTA